MISITGERSRTQREPAAGRGRAALILIMLYLWLIGPAFAQTPTPQQYRIVAGDKIGVSVFGQPDLSSEATVDQNGNLRLPVIGDVSAANLTLSELEKSISGALEQGYVRRPVVSVKISEYRPIYVLGMVRTPGLYPYREGEPVLAAIARAGGYGAPDQIGTGNDLFQTEERVRLLEVNRAGLLARRARLLAQQNGKDSIDFPDSSGLAIDPGRLAQIRDGEQAAFIAERTAEQQETEALEKQFPRLQAEIASLKEQQELETRQRELHKQLLVDYEQLAKSGLARKPAYIEVKREEARIEENIARLKSEALKADLSVGELQYKIAELHNIYRRRVMTELRETDRSLLELTVTLPSAQRARNARARQIGWLTAKEGQEPPLVVVRGKGKASVRFDATVDFLLQPGDIVQVGSLLPSPLEQSADRAYPSGPTRTSDRSPLQVTQTAAPHDAPAAPGNEPR